MQDFRNLLVWRRAHDFALSVNQLTRELPRRGTPGLAGQLQRAALSISANIAEGCGRESNADLAKFLQIAIGSASEVENHLEFCIGAALITRRDFDQCHAEVVQIRRMLIGLLKKVRARPAGPTHT
jgi:four helix bundle protein